MIIDLLVLMFTIAMYYQCYSFFYENRRDNKNRDIIKLKDTVNIIERFLYKLYYAKDLEQFYIYKGCIERHFMDLKLNNLTNDVPYSVTFSIISLYSFKSQILIRESNEDYKSDEHHSKLCAIIFSHFKEKIQGHAIPELYKINEKIKEAYNELQ